MTEMHDLVEILQLIKDNIKLVIFGLSLLAFFIFFLLNRSYVEIRVKALWYKLPLIGKNARLAKNREVQDFGQQKWFKVEKDVGDAFRPYYALYDKTEDSYIAASSYLDRAHDTATKPMGLWQWLFIIVAVSVESAGFAYILAGFTLTDASEALQIKGALAIGLLVSGVLVLFTHYTGYSIAQNSVYKKILEEWEEYQQRTGDNSKLSTLRMDSVQWSTGKNHLDDNKEPFIKLLNRIKKHEDIKPKYTLITSCVAIIMVIACAATYVRISVLDTYLNETVELGAPSTQMMPEDYGSDDISLDLSLDDQQEERQPPQEVIDTNNQASDKAFKDRMTSFEHGSWVTFGLLGVLFLALQGISVFISRNAYLKGSESHITYKVVNEFKSVSEFQSYFQARRDDAEAIGQSVMRDLQAKIRQSTRLSGSGSDMNLINNMQDRTFAKFLATKSEELAAKVKKERQDKIDEARNEAAHKREMKEIQSGLETGSSTPHASQLEQKQETAPRTIQDIIIMIEAEDISLLSDEEIALGYAEMDKRTKSVESETPKERLARIRSSMDNTSND